MLYNKIQIFLSQYQDLCIRTGERSLVMKTLCAGLELEKDQRRSLTKKIAMKLSSKSQRKCPALLVSNN